MCEYVYIYTVILFSLADPPLVGVESLEHGDLRHDVQEHRGQADDHRQRADHIVSISFNRTRASQLRGASLLQRFRRAVYKRCIQKHNQSINQPTLRPDLPLTPGAP